MNNGTGNLVSSGTYTPMINPLISSQISLSNSMCQSYNNNINFTNTNSAATSFNNTNNSINNISLNMKSRFPRLQECAHFHYEVSTVDIPKNFKVILCAENESNENSKPNLNNNSPNNNCNNTLTSSTISALSNNSVNSNAADSSFWFHLQVTSNDKKWIIYRTNENFKYLDKHLHDCIFDRKFSCLEEPISVSSLATGEASSIVTSNNSKNKPKTSDLVTKQLRQNMMNYLARFCEIAFINPINCGPILNWFEIDNRGNRLFAIDDSPINIPGVAAAVVKKRYVAQGLDEISLDVGNMISVIDMPPHDESVWWRGKKELEVGFFPFECVELIKCNQHLSSNVTEHLPKLSQNQSVRLKHGKLITLLRSFFNTRPARNQLQSKGILKQRVFACDLGEHLSNTQQDVPKILTICTEFIEKHGIVDGIYRHTGLQSNIQRLRNAFDEEKFHEIEQEIYINDVHAVSSLLKMYFRELPNPLLTYQLYQKFITIAESLMKSVNVEDKIFEIHDVVQQLPPPHYRTLAFLMQHLHRLSESSPETSMNTKNLAIVWAPNLLKSKEMDTNCMQLDMLHSITLQANISEFLIANADTIFNDKFASLVRKDPKTNVLKYRPISVCYNTGGTKLLSLEEAQDKYKQVGPAEIPKYHTVIEIPDHKKKKQKDKKSNLNSNNSIVQPPANIHIQQQFDMLQQQQQQQQQFTNLPASASFNSVTSNATPISTINQTQMNPAASNTNNNNNNGSSSPAFISLFRNLRGSLKHQPGSTISHNEINNSSFRQSTLNQTPTQIYDNDRVEINHTTPVSIVPNAAKLNRTNSNSTFKATSPTNEIKNDYSNCISQLQSAAAQAMNSNLHQHNSYLTGNNLSPSEMGSNCAHLTESVSNSAPAPVLFRNNKYNQSLNSNHSNTMNTNQHLNNLLLKLNENSSNHQNNQPALSTFKDSSQSIVNNAVIETRKSETNNPIPSKRRTIQGQPSILSNSNTLITFTQPTKITPQNAITKNSGLKNEEIEAKDQNENNKENRIDTKVNSLNNEDDMQQLVEYINQFEKENISTAVENVGCNSYIEIAPIIQPLNQNQVQTIGPNQQSVSSMIEIDAIETSSKLRLSASSLSSSAESSSNDINNEYDDIFAVSNERYDDSDDKSRNETMATIKITPNETNPMIVSTSNLNSILTSSANDKTRNNFISSQFIDRRTYIINKVYDTLENKVPTADIECLTNDEEEENENEDQYEKVVLNQPKKFQSFESRAEAIENEYGEYHNDLLVSSSNSNSEISNQSNMIKIVGKTINSSVNNEHIYVNVNLLENKNDPLIRESLGFEVQDMITQDKNIDLKEQKDLNKNNLSQKDENIDKNFDNELVELNHQINKLLTSNNENKTNEVETEKSDSPLENYLSQNDSETIKINIDDTPRYDHKRPMSVNYLQQNQTPEAPKTPNEFVKRRTTLSSCSNHSVDVNKINNQNVIETSVEIKNKTDETAKCSDKPVSFRLKTSSMKVGPNSKSIDEVKVNQSEPTNTVINDNEIFHYQSMQETKQEEVRHSFRVQAQAAVEKDSNTQISVDSNSNNSDLSFKRKSSQSFDELNRKKPENYEINRDYELENIKPSNQNTKNRQSIQVSNTNFPQNEKNGFNLNTNNKSMSKSLQDNSKLINSFSEFKVSLQSDSSSCLSKENSFDNNLESNETNVKSKIKLMESIVGNQSSSHIPLIKLKKGERSSSASSTSSTSSSKSPPLSPHLNTLSTNTVVKSETSCSLASSSETKPAKQNPPMVMARSVIWQSSTNNSNQNNTNQLNPLHNINTNEKEDNQFENLSIKSTVIIIGKDDMFSENPSDIITKTNTLPNPSLKEKRRTVKEMISKFEPK